MTVSSFQDVLTEATQTRDYGRLIPIAQSMAEIHFENGRIAEGEHLFAELAEFKASVCLMTENEVREVLDGLLDWSLFCLKATRRRANPQTSN